MTGAAMTSLRVGRTCLIASLVMVSAHSSLAQGRRTGGPGTATAGQFTPFGARGADPMAGPLVTGAPFSADATTTVVQTLGDGTRIEQRSTAKFYRERMG